MIEQLRTAIPAMSDRDAPFAASLIGSFEKKGSLTDKQWYWVQRLLKPKAPQQAPVKLLGNMQPLADMFRKARNHLKWPKLTLHVGDEQTAYTFSLAQDSSKNPGFIYVKRFGTYIGKVSPTGDFSRSWSCKDEDVALVSDFSANPAGLAAQHGRLTGHCCFCSKKLSDERSVEVGYGETCAKNYGLPWG
jgi:hypothetical protein